jgi:hypothetical protein
MGSQELELSKDRLHEKKSFGYLRAEVLGPFIIMRAISFQVRRSGRLGRMQNAETGASPISPRLVAEIWRIGFLRRLFGLSAFSIVTQKAVGASQSRSCRWITYRCSASLRLRLLSISILD